MAESKVSLAARGAGVEGPVSSIGANTGWLTRLSGWRQKSWSIYAYLMAFGLALILPMILLSAALLRSNDITELERLDQRVELLALETARDLDRELLALRTTLEVMAHSPTLTKGDFEGFRSFATTAAEKQGVNIVLRQHDGQQVLNTSAANAAIIRNRSGMGEQDRQAIAAGQVRVTDIYRGIFRDRPIFVVSVPVASGPYTQHSLNAAVEPDSLVGKLNLGDLPRGWMTCIFDRSGNLVTRSGASAAHQSHPAMSRIRQRMTGTHGVVRASLDDGEPAIFGYQRSQVSGWLVVVTVPLAVHEAAGTRSHRLLAVLTLGLIASSIGLAAWFGRTIAYPVSLLAERARQLEAMGPRPPQPVRLKEVGDVMERLDEAAVRLSASTQDLRLSEARYRQLATSTPAGLFRANAEGALTFVNGRWCAITDIEPAQALGMDWLHVIHAEDRALVGDAWQRALAADGLMQVECRIAGQQGRTAWALCEVVPELSEDGRRIGAVGSLTDLTERKSAEHVRRESEDRLRLALEVGRMGTFTWTLATDMVELDSIGAAILGRPLAACVLPNRELIGQAHVDELARIEDFNAALLASDAPVSLICRFRRANDGATRYVALRASRQAAGVVPDGPPVRVIGVLFDVTEQTLAEQSLEELNVALEQRVLERTAELATANERLQNEMHQREAVQAALNQAQKLEALGKLTSSVAHDFNNQLMAVLGGLELIEKGVQDPRLLRHAQNARSAAKRASQLTDQLLSFSRKGELAPERIDIAGTLSGLEDVLRHAVGSKVKRRVDIAHDIAPAWADPDQLHATLVNLAINARDAMPGGGQLVISAANVVLAAGDVDRGLAPGRYVSIVLADTGVGMTDAVRQRAGEPFFTTKPRGRGTGLGLAMAFRFVEQSHGHLTITSREHAGTRIEILLPAASPDALAQAARQGRASDSERPAGAGSVLCVDDDRHAAEVTSEMLRMIGFDVLVQTDPARALAQARALPHLDVLVTDIDMPGMDGLALAAAVRQIFPDLHVLYVTGHAQHLERLQEHGDAARSASLLRKPFSSADLRARLLGGERSVSIDLSRSPAEVA
ncbi:MAG: ATP-binding protein [Hyphomicrobiaceae bacterium]